MESTRDLFPSVVNLYLFPWNEWMVSISFLIQPLPRRLFGKMYTFSTWPNFPLRPCPKQGEKKRMMMTGMTVMVMEKTGFSKPLDRNITLWLSVYFWGLFWILFSCPPLPLSIPQTPSIHECVCLPRRALSCSILHLFHPKILLLIGVHNLHQM